MPNPKKKSPKSAKPKPKEATAKPTKSAPNKKPTKPKPTPKPQPKPEFSDSQILTLPKSENLRKTDKQLLEDYLEQLALMEDRVRGVVNGYNTGAYFYGPTGVSKSHTTLKTLNTLGARYHQQKGKITPPVLFDLIAKHHDKVIVLDDVSAIFDHPVARQIFLAALDANELSGRIVEYKTANSIRPPVLFTGGIIAISNIPLDGHKNEILAAVKSRVPHLHINPSDEQIFALMRSVAENGLKGLPPKDCLEVCNFVINEVQKANAKPSMRLYVDGALADYRQWRDGKSVCHWKDLTVSRLEGKQVEILHPKNDISRAERTDSERRICVDICIEFSETKERIEEWKARTGLSQAAFYRRKAEAEKMGLLPN